MLNFNDFNPVVQRWINLRLYFVIFRLKIHQGRLKAEGRIFSAAAPD